MHIAKAVHDNRAYFDEHEQQVAPLIANGEERSTELRQQIEQRLKDNQSDD
jgi:hypothetical protein